MAKMVKIVNLDAGLRRWFTRLERCVEAVRSLREDQEFVPKLRTVGV
jgi:hypothetical protein